MGTLVTPQNIYSSVSEFISQAGYKNPDQFISNPANMPPKQPPEPTSEEKIATQKAQVEVQKLQLQASEIELNTKIKQQELELKKREAQVDFMIKQQELELKKQKLEQGEMEIALEATQKRPVAIGDT